MIEGQHLIEEQQAGVGDAELVCGERGQPLDLANCVVGEEADGPGGKGRQARRRAGLCPPSACAQHGEDVAFKVRPSCGLQ